jgi:hypothetical protein
MQEVSGAYSTDLNGVARLSSIGMAVNQGLHSFLRKSFAPQIQTIARRAETPDGYLSACCSRAAPDNGFGTRAIECQTGVAPDCVFPNMMIDCSCVCHSRFQNEVIGG